MLLGSGKGKWFSLVFLTGPSVLLSAIDGCMFLENLNGYDPSYKINLWFWKIFRKIVQVQIYCIAKNGKSCWRWPDTLEEQAPAKWCNNAVSFIIANELYSVFLWQRFLSNLYDWTFEIRLYISHWSKGVLWCFTFSDAFCTSVWIGVFLGLVLGLGKFICQKKF